MKDDENDVSCSLHLDWLFPSPLLSRLINGWQVPSCFFSFFWQWMGNRKADENQKPQARLTERLKLLKDSWHWVHMITIRKYILRLKKAG